MASRIAAFLPRFALLTLGFLLATATITYAAEQQLTSSSASKPASTAAATAILVVPDVRHQAYVFAKGTLDDAGFAWRVAGPVGGYSANTVISQEPAPGTRVVDTGAPRIVLHLARNPKYEQHGAPESGAPYQGTEVVLVGASRPATPATASEPASKPASGNSAKPALKKPAVKKPAVKKPTVKKPAAPAARKPSGAKKPAAKRPPAFVVAGAPKEPLDEMPLPDRAHLLASWLDKHRTPTRANVDHWAYQHAWVVTGARFGWSHGAEALRTLIAADRRAERLWGLDGRSETTARRALAYVEARAR